jgi:hypothetical protein
MLLMQRGPTGLMQGPMLSGNAEVENLQRALANLAIATNRPQINPGAADGVVGDRTVAAVIAGMDLLTSQLPTWAYLSLQAALAAGSMTSQAKSVVTSLAAPLTVAANTAAVKFKQNPTTGPLMPAQQGFFAPGWYKTPAGIALILIVGFVGYKLFMAQPPGKAA